MVAVFVLYPTLLRNKRQDTIALAYQSSVVTPVSWLLFITVLQMLESFEHIVSLPMKMLMITVWSVEAVTARVYQEITLKETRHD
ncbi:putative transmembrane protein [Toxoplasma gondii TgCatPRC2]|uniref:Putative transmembrane protein n=1 Tax=Toxoplasma gondii TgCatPRC2 TaxID=1130821 RepID=A0A151HM00_TOXGO|nr:putative transmembrane protein [Toxoplasma gondii TgCatPRC2]